MLIIANSLFFNGGTTFILRLSKELKKQNKNIGVFVLHNKIDCHLELEIKKYAKIYYLKDFIYPKLSFAWKTPLGCFFPLKYNKLFKLIDKYSGELHIMGMLGLFFSLRVAIKKNIKISIGVYHQYEYMFISKSFFSKYLQSIISTIDCKSLVFFNEANISSYSSFFNKNFKNANLLPIGVEIPEKSNIDGDFDSVRIVSIGNLYDFKTYNLHIINIIEELLPYNANITYEIYGKGSLEDKVKKLITDKGYEKRVFLKGSIPYEQFQNILEGSFLFVGSGTALIEAAAIGIPSLTGIESTDTPITFGFLNDINGFSYNEINDFQETFLMTDKIKQILTNKDEWKKSAIACQLKSKDFSMSITATGLLNIYNKLGYFNLNSLPFSRAFSSFVLIGILNKLKIDKSFSGRHN
jgi:1,2-diacylglycerol 3-alpha-glucosyltransferase